MYELVEVSSLGEDRLLGYAIKKEGTDRLESTVLYKDGEYDEAVERVHTLNEAVRLRNFWPRADDPEVQNLLSDPDFQPVEYEEVEVPDLEKSNLVYVWEQPPLHDREGRKVQDGVARTNTDGTPVIDWHNSEVVMKTERHPKRVTAKSRIDLACELVARARAEATTS